MITCQTESSSLKPKEINEVIQDCINQSTNKQNHLPKKLNIYHYENREIKVKGRAVYDDQQHYENAAFDNQNKIVNMYEGLKKGTDDHSYADLENN